MKALLISSFLIKVYDFLLTISLNLLLLRGSLQYKFIYNFHGWNLIHVDGLCYFFMQIGSMFVDKSKHFWLTISIDLASPVVTYSATSISVYVLA